MDNTIALCSLWDRNYNTKGVALLTSVYRYIPDATVYVLALDDVVWNYLANGMINAGNVIPICPSQIETRELAQARSNRTYQEYCWTLASYFTNWCAEKFDLPMISYIDSDCYLFNSLDALYDEVSGFPVAITPHRYTPSEAARLKGAGVYNVGWVYFDKTGYDCLLKWRNDCLAWCYRRIEKDGRFADQGYLNDWPRQWRAHVVYNLGVNLAPWNQYQYTYLVNSGNGHGPELVVTDGRRYDSLLFYHFHGFEGVGRRTGYPLHPMVAKHIYEPYEREYANHGRLG